jgi:septal ring factor EnvC (AmiA/AmiB activator)
MTDDWDEQISRAYGHIARRERDANQFHEPPIGSDVRATELDLGDPHERRRQRFERLRASLPSHKSSEPPAIPWNAIDQRIAEAIAAQHEYLMEELMPRIIARLQQEAEDEIGRARKLIEVQVAELQSALAQLKTALAEAEAIGLAASTRPRRCIGAPRRSTNGGCPPPMRAPVVRSMSPRSVCAPFTSLHPYEM